MNNKATAVGCHMCGTPRSGAVVVPVKRGPPIPPPAAVPWTCSACTYQNGATRRTCEVCESPAPRPVVVPVPVPADAAVAAAAPPPPPIAAVAPADNNDDAEGDGEGDGEDDEEEEKKAAELKAVVEAVANIDAAESKAALKREAEPVIQLEPLRALTDNDRLVDDIRRSDVDAVLARLRSPQLTNSSSYGSWLNYTVVLPGTSVTQELSPLSTCLGLPAVDGHRTTILAALLTAGADANYTGGFRGYGSRANTDGVVGTGCPLFAALSKCGRGDDAPSALKRRRTGDHDERKIETNIFHTEFEDAYDGSTEVELLLRFGANVASTTRYGENALHLAARYSTHCPWLPSLLVAFGVDFAACTIAGRTPLSLLQKPYAPYPPSLAIDAPVFRSSLLAAADEWLVCARYAIQSSCELPAPDIVTILEYIISLDELPQVGCFLSSHSFCRGFFPLTCFL
jgi:hypothetical protein